MATERLNPNGWDSGWPFGSYTNVDEPVASADGSTVSTTTTNDIVTFNLSNITTIKDLDIVTGVDFTVRCRGTSVGGPEPADLHLDVELLINSVSRGTTRIGFIGGTMSNRIASNGGWDGNWSVADLNTAQVRITSRKSGGIGVTNTWYIDAIDAVVTYTPVDPITRDPAKGTLALTGKVPTLQEIWPSVSIPVAGTDLTLASTFWYAIGASERVNVDSWNSGWPTGFVTNIDEPVSTPDGSSISTTLNADAVIVGFQNFSEIDTLDTVINVLPTVRMRVDHTYLGFGTEVAPTFTVELLIGGVSQGSTSVDIIGYGAFHNYDLNVTGWNQDWTLAQLNGAQLRITSATAANSTDTFYLDCIDLVVEYEPQPPIFKDPGKGSLSLAGKSVSLYQEFFRAPAKGSLALDAKANDFTWTQTALPFYATRILDGHIYSYTVNHIAKTGEASLAMSGKAPIRIADRLRLPSGGSLALAGKQPVADRSENVWKQPPKVSRFLEPEIPFVKLSDNVAENPQRGLLTLTGKTPTPDQTRSMWIDVGRGSLSLAGVAPGYNFSALRPVVVGTLALAGKQPIASFRDIAVPAEGSLTLTAYAPNTAPLAASVTLTGYTVTVFQDTTISVDAGSLSLVPKAVFTTNTLAIDATGALALQGKAVTFSFTSSLTPGAPGIIVVTEDRDIEFIATPTDVVEY